nr:endo-1,3(4)-beta-glucanase [Quercus suber]
MHLSTLAAGLAMMSSAGMAQYVLEDDYFKGNFFDQFSFFTAGDPTHGFVQYQSQAESESQLLVNSSSTNAYIGVDHTNVAPSGRNSVRLTSNKAYDTGLIIIDLEHMPVGCGTWYVFVHVPHDIARANGAQACVLDDIIEGVHDQATNDMTLHTNPGCTITNNNAFTGSISTSNCDVNAAGQGTNQGCSITTTNTNTYGNGFNTNGGGIYATEITSSAISIYFFEHGSAPSDISSSNPNPSNWGKPIAQYQGGCDIAEHFKGMQIVFDTTFCGDWAGAVWGSFSTCSAKASTCNDFVQNNPSAFADAYWSVNSLKVYSSTGNAWSETTVAAGSSSIASEATSTSANIIGESNVSPAPTSKSAQPTFVVVSETNVAPAPTSEAAQPSPAIVGESNVAPAPTTATTFAQSTRPQGFGQFHTRSAFGEKDSSPQTTEVPVLSSTITSATSTATPSSSVEVQTATQGWLWDGGSFTYESKRGAELDAELGTETKTEVVRHQHKKHHERHHRRHHGAGRLLQEYISAVFQLGESTNHAYAPPLILAGNRAMSPLLVGRSEPTLTRSMPFRACLSLGACSSNHWVLRADIQSRYVYQHRIYSAWFRADYYDVRSCIESFSKCVEGQELIECANESAMNTGGSLPYL